MLERTLVYYNEAVELYCGGVCKSPRMAIIYPVYGCNFSCKGCLYADYNTKGKYMDFEKFKDITLQLKKHGVRSIEFCGGGEPILHPDICKMITWVTDYLHMSLGIMTNGSMLNEQISYLVATRVNYIRISLYEHSYNNVMKKIEKLILTKQEVEGNLVIGSKFLINKDNEDFVIKKVKETAKNPGINHVSVKALRGNGLVEDYSDSEEKIRALGYEKINANLKKSYLRYKCWTSSIHTLIDPVGDVYICCYYMDRKDDHCIGNVYEKSFSEVWGGQKHIEKLRNIDAQKCNVFDCRWHKYNSEMLELLRPSSHHQFC